MAKKYFLLAVALIALAVLTSHLLPKLKKGQQIVEVLYETAFTGRHLLSAEEDEASFVEDTPKPTLTYSITGPDFPYIQGTDELHYQWLLSHRVEPEHTAITVSFEVDVPSSTFNEDSLNVTLSSHAFELNETRLEPLSVTYSSKEEKVRLSVDLWDYLWVNLTEPWRRPDCWWTTDKFCYQTEHSGCVFVDLSPNQNWDPFFCYRFEIKDCLPFNVSSECYYVNTTECLEQVFQSLANPELARCPALYNTTCIQVNDRGLFYGQYDWTKPEASSVSVGYEKELCGMPDEDMWAFEESVDGVLYIVEIFLSVDEKAGCTTVKMTPKDSPRLLTTTYNPYNKVPTTDEFILAKECLNVNTTGYYEPPASPIQWKDFNLTVEFSGVISNYVLVNQLFTSNLIANITQRSKRPLHQLTNATAELVYEVILPWVWLTAEPSFSEKGYALKHEMIHHMLRVHLPHAISFGIQVTLSFEKLSNEIKMTFLNETPHWYVSGEMFTITDGFMVNETHDESSAVSLESMLSHVESAQSPVIHHRFVSSDTDKDVVDILEISMPPVLCIADNLPDRAVVEFSSRVLTSVEPGEVLKIPVGVTVLNAPRGRYSGGRAAALTVTDQPFIPVIAPLVPTLHPDTGDDFVFTFDLSHTLEFPVYDIWMNISCPDVQTVSHTLSLGFLEPTNITTDSHYDLAVVMVSSLHFHLTQLTPEVSFCGNQTFHMWDNRMLTHQPVTCLIYLSYRREEQELVLPYEAAEEDLLTLSGISFDLYEKNLLQNTTMYQMAIGSNSTFIINITLSETSTKLKVRLKMPSPVLAVLYSLVIHQGTNVQFVNATKYEIQPTEADIETWTMGPRTEPLLNFGLVTNYADNSNTFDGDNLVLEFNCVLRDTVTVVKNSEHTLAVTVSYSGSEDLEKEKTVSVLEPDVFLSFHLTNESTDGDPGDIFEYYLTLNHSQLSQTPAHHVVIRFHLPYMSVYRDFVPGNDSQTPKTSISDTLGPIEADSVLQLYLYKLEMHQFISGTFLIQISTKLTMGIAILASANYSMESFYQWGRHYYYSTVSQNVINIRNATLYFVGTSQPQTPDDKVTIHEQVSYRLFVPLPPIPTNLTLKIDLPEREVTMKKWEAEKLRMQVPRKLPTEQTFYDQGCLEEYHYEHCFCSQTNPGKIQNIIMKSNDGRCYEVQKENCTTVVNMTALQILTERASQPCLLNVSATPANCSGDHNCTATNVTDRPPTNVSTCSTPDSDFETERVVCEFFTSQMEQCKVNALKSCHMNPNNTHKWPFVVFHWREECVNVTSGEADPNQNNSSWFVNCTKQGGENCTNSTWNEDITTIPPDLLTLFSDVTTISINGSEDTETEICHLVEEVDCEQFAVDFCAIFTLRNCSSDLVEDETHKNTSTVFEEGNPRWNCFCNDLPIEEKETQWLSSPYHICENTTEAAIIWAQNQSPNKTELNFDLCEEDDTVMLAVADVISTQFLSTREGAVCHFIGGNRHDRFQAGVTYISEYLPANDTDVGDSVSAAVTLVILDDAAIVRGDVLEINGTSIFSYVTKPIPPSSIFRENCTCYRRLVDYFDPDALMDCVCETVHLEDKIQSDCNYTSTYEDEDTSYPFQSSCGCINYCLGNVLYFENPLKSFNILTFDPSLCDCQHLNHTIAEGKTKFMTHVEACGQSYSRYYHCDSINVTVSHHTFLLNEKCTCLLQPLDTLCTCNATQITRKITTEFEGRIYSFQGCNNGSQNGDEWEFLFEQSTCVCYESEESTTFFPVMEAPSQWTDTTTILPRNNLHQVSSCSCNITCKIFVEEETVSKVNPMPLRHHSVEYVNNLCECVKEFVQDHNVSSFLNWTKGFSSFSQGVKTVNRDFSNSTCVNCSVSTNQSLPIPEVHYYLNCYCFNVSRTLTNIAENLCEEIPPVEVLEGECFVPPDNETQFILDNWDYNATIIDQMVTSLSHEVIIVEPELQVSFTRHAEPSIVDKIDEVAFDFTISHTVNSDAPANNVFLRLDAINFTRNYAVAELEPSSVYSNEHCFAGDICSDKYWNKKGLFHLPYLPVDPAEVFFVGSFNLSVGDQIDFIADSLLTATGIVTYDSCIVDFSGRSYGPITASDTVQIDAPTISAVLDFCTAYSHLFFLSSGDDLPQVFSVGDYIRLKATIWVPEITLHVTNFTISSDMVNVTIVYGEVFLTDQIWSRSDTGSIYEELSLDDDIHEGLIYDGVDYTYASFQEGGLTVVPGVVVNEADNVADEEDNLEMTLTFRVNDVPSWREGVQIKFVISSIYISDYSGDLVTLTDESVILTMVEPQLSLRVEILDHQYQIDQVTNEALYTCQDNTCCNDVTCQPGQRCITDVESISECSTAECLCYSGYTSHEDGGCSAVGRTSGDVITFGLTATHHVDYTGNAFDVIIQVHSGLASSLLPNSHFISHPFSPDYISMMSIPSLTQTSEESFTLYIKRFNHEQMCERFAVPFRVDPVLRLGAGEAWTANATLSHYSAKPYDIGMDLNEKSRFYEFDGYNSFVFHAPAPSATFLMEPLTGGSTKIDFRVYSSSNDTHTVMVNLRQEASVTFRLEFVVPKVQTDLSIILALPEGTGFQFEQANQIFQGSQVEVPERDVKATVDLKGRSYVHINCPNVYSVPNILTKQRLFNGTVQRKFKTMRGETQPYPAEPSCSTINSTLYENPLILGCFNDSTHYFPVSMATEEHPTNSNYSMNMTNILCYQLCRNEGYFISGTKNGSDCYCGNFTTHKQYTETGGSFIELVNITTQESYLETFWVACNKTGIKWMNQTVNGTCYNKETYQKCVTELSAGCQNKMYSACSANFLAEIDCYEVAAVACNESSESNCNTVMVQKCYDVLFKTCAHFWKVSCDLQVTNGSIHTSCMKRAEKSYRLQAVTECLNQTYVDCYERDYNNCTLQGNQTCASIVSGRCSDWASLEYSSEEHCHNEESSSCFASSSAPCSVNSKNKCENQTGTCMTDTVITRDVSVLECVDALWYNCSTCMYDIFWECHYTQGDSQDKCSEDAVDACLSLCYQQNCSLVFHPVLETYIYPNCSWVDALPTHYIYPSNCSVEVTKWREVTRLVEKKKPIPVSSCDIPCSGNSNITCGSEDFILISGLLKMSLVQQSCDWYTGLYEEEEDTIVWEFQLQVDALATKGIPELLHPLISYTHGLDKMVTLIPFAPFKLEAGEVDLLMNVWVAGELTGYHPGDLIEYYTEVFHHPNSTVTARDITVWWIFPSYVEFVNLTNHAHAHYDYHEMQPVVTTSTDPSKGITFHVTTLYNTDMVSFHFFMRLDPQSSLPAGNYHLVAFAEMDYFSWDLHNPYEDNYKHNVLSYYHDPLPTRVEFRIKAAPIVRPQRDDVQLKMYSFLYDESSNIFYVCFYNRSAERRKNGGCYMTGDLISPLPDPYPSCEDYCNCTFQSGWKDESNCTDVMPRPENCTCGCYPDCQEMSITCKDGCRTCLDCNATTCSRSCDMLYTNCTATCCESDCSQEFDACTTDCGCCHVQLGCTVDGCKSDCYDRFVGCLAGCFPVVLSCESNCTLDAQHCSDLCIPSCENVTSVEEDSSHDGVLSLKKQEDCTIACSDECLQQEKNCTKDCCFDSCEESRVLCLGTCIQSCNADVTCIQNCTFSCNISFSYCTFDCELEAASCSGQCYLHEVACQLDCPAECYVEICSEETHLNCTDHLPTTTDPDFVTVSANSTVPNFSNYFTEYPEIYNATSNCTLERKEVCSTELTTACRDICLNDCLDVADSCRSNCCKLACLETLQLCKENCTMRGELDKFCIFECEDDFERCSTPCDLIPYVCKSDCNVNHQSCIEDCLACQPFWNLGVNGSEGMNDTSLLIMNYRNKSTSLMENFTCSCDNLTSVNMTYSTSEDHGNCTCNVSKVLSSETSIHACSKSNMSSCMSVCNASATECHGNCPCNEECHISAATCILGCVGCQPSCYEECHHNCSMTQDNCQQTCIQVMRPIALYDCLDSCRNACVSLCMSNNSINGSCVSECSVGIGDCSQQCIKWHLPGCQDYLVDEYSNEDLQIGHNSTSWSTTTLPSTTPWSFNSTEFDAGMFSTTLDGLQSLPPPVHNCTIQCLEDNLSCLNVSNSSLSGQTYETCSLGFYTCSENCIEDYQNTCCDTRCHAGSTTCLDACQDCDMCLEACKSSCKRVQSDCIRDCQLSNSHVVDCDGYAACMLTCSELDTQNCTLECLHQYVSHGCSSSVNCELLDECLSHSRRRRHVRNSEKGMLASKNGFQLGPSAVTTPATADNTQGEVFVKSASLYRRRREVNFQGSNLTGEDFISSNDTLDVFDPCSLQEHLQNFTACYKACQNIFKSCSFENETYCCEDGGICHSKMDQNPCISGCSQYSPVQMNECFVDCEVTTTFCDLYCQNCSDLTNCSNHCSDVCPFDETFNISECFRHCELSMFSPNCSSSCDSVKCPNGNSSWDCDCFNHTILSSNEDCMESEWTSSNRTICLEVVAYQPCSCQCLCKASASKYLNWRGLHRSVRNILGCNSHNGTLYGLSRNGMAIMESLDYGQSWWAISNDAWSDVHSSWWFASADRLDGEELVLLNTTSSQFIFSSDVWNSTFKVSRTGVHFQGTFNVSEFWSTLGVWSCCD